MKDRRIEMIEMKEDVVLLRADAAAFADLDRHRARDDVAGREVLGGWRIALHEALAFGIGEIAAFAARALGDEAARAVNAGRVELHELHVLQRQAGAQDHRIAVARAGMRGSGGEIGAAIAARRKDDERGAEAVNLAGRHVERDDAAAGAVFIHDEVDGEIFDVELGLVAQRLAVKRVQDRVARAVGGGAGALRDAFAEIRGHAAEGALVDLAFFGAREGHAEMFELVDGFRRLAAEIFDGVLVAEPVGALDRVVHVPAPVIDAHVAERGGDAALRRNGVAAGRKHLGDVRRAQALFDAAERGAKTRAARADDDDVECVIVELVFSRHERSLET